MGLFGGDSTSLTSVTNTTNQTDKRVGASDSATVVQVQAGGSLELVDDGAVATAQASFDAFNDLALKAFGFAEDQLDSERGLVSQSLDLVETRTQSEETGLAGQGIKTLALVAVAVVAMFFAPKLLKG